MAYISLRAIREQKGLTIAQLAGKTSISIRTLQAYESGDRGVAPDDLRKLARVLLVTPAEILQPAEPPSTPAVAAPPPPSAPSPVPATVRIAPEVPPVTANGPNSAPDRGPERGPEFAPRPPAFGGAPRPTFESGPDRGPHRPFSAPSGAPRTATPRPPRSFRPVRPPSPATSGQLDQIRNFGRRLGLDEAQLVEAAGAPLASLTLPAARTAIAKLRTQMEESGTWRPRVGEGPDQEGEYLTRLHESAVPIEVLLFGGERVRGVIDSFTPYVINVRQSDGTMASLRKLAVVYYRTLEAVDDPR